MNKIIFWNARSVHNKNIDLNHLINVEKPDVLALCETWLKNKDNFKLQNFKIIRYDRPEQIGGLAICIKDNIQFKQINLKDGLKHKIEAMAVKISYKNKWMNILLIYNPCNNLKQNDIEYYSEQISDPKLIIGDFNAHHESWNPNSNLHHTNKTGKSLFEVITENNIMLLTPPGQITRIDPKNAKGSTLDLILASPTLSHLEVETGPNIGSDHLPIIVKDKTIQKSPQSKEKKWKFNNEGWIKYQKKLNNTDTIRINSLNELKNLIKNTGKKYFKFEEYDNKSKYHKPWWNEKCKQIIKKRNKAYNKWKKRPNNENLGEYKKLSIEARKIIEKEKKETWEKFCNSIDFNTPSKKVWNFIKKKKKKKKN